MTQSKKSQTIQVGEDGHGCRIDQWLSQHYTEFSRNHWIDKLKRGLILINNQNCLPKTRLKVGDKINLDEGCFANEKIITSLPQPMSLDIVYEDDDILLLNKPANLVVHPGAGHAQQTLLNGLLAHNPNADSLPRAGIVHRLDKDTTGIMIVAKTIAAYHFLVEQLQLRHVKREYYALVYGHLISGGTIRTEFGRHPKNRVKMAVVKHGKEAITHYLIKQQYGFFTGLNIQLETGRTHQIRVHMAYSGHPLVGDQLYGNRLQLPPGHTEQLKKQLQQFNRQALHAHSLSFIHPKTGKPLTFSVPLADDLKKLIADIDHYFENRKT